MIKHEGLCTIKIKTATTEIETDITAQEESQIGNPETHNYLIFQSVDKVSYVIPYKSIELIEIRKK